MPRYTKQDIIQQLQEYAAQEGKTPTFAGGFPVGRATIVRHFGGWNKALQAAELPLNQEWNPSLALVCKQCGKNITRKPSQAKKVQNVFCDQSCAAIYNNAHKKHGTRRSKIEVWIEQKLIERYPKLTIHANRRDAINAELDFYFPDLRFAVELNGIFHYEPIYGTDKLESIQSNDNRRFQACLEQGIELCIIDISSMKNFKPEKAQRYLNIITALLNQKLG